MDEKVCLIKHFYIKDDKIKGQYVARLVKGQGFEISWQGVNKHKARKGFQYMLEQLGGNQFRRFSLSAEKRKVIAGRPPANEEDQDAGGGISSSNMENVTRATSSNSAGSTATSTAMVVPSMDGMKSSFKGLWTLWPMMAPWRLSSPGTTSLLMPLSPMSLRS